MTKSPSGVEFCKMNTAYGSGIVQIVGHQYDFAENGSEMGWTSPKTDSGRRAVH